MNVRVFHVCFVRLFLLYYCVYCLFIEITIKRYSITFITDGKHQILVYVS